MESDKIDIDNIEVAQVAVKRRIDRVIEQEQLAMIKYQQQFDALMSRSYAFAQKYEVEQNPEFQKTVAEQTEKYETHMNDLKRAIYEAELKKVEIDKLANKTLSQVNEDEK